MLIVATSVLCIVQLITLEYAYGGNQIQ